MSARKTDIPTSPASALSRRTFLLAAPMALAGCVSGGIAPVSRYADPRLDPRYLAMYGPMPDEEFPIPRTDLSVIDPAYLRRQVEYPTDRRPGTIVIDPATRYLYLVQFDGTAMRYGIGVGREGFSWSGDATIRRKQAWPKWTPPAEMVARDEEAAKWADGMPPGLGNPLGARALYLFQGDRDTLYRIHGTNVPSSIGSNVSSGCIRLINQDIIDLYSRVPIGTEVVVLGSGASGGGVDYYVRRNPRSGNYTSMTSLL
jgi:lipoprotein-anchoring transpeptidase ErfK/SrfK